MSLRKLIGVVVLLSLAACTLDIDDPTGVKQRRTQARRAECEQIDSITHTHYEQAITIYEQQGYFILDNKEDNQESR